MPMSMVVWQSAKNVKRNLINQEGLSKWYIYKSAGMSFAFPA